jgi:aryl-alcohol dehydrogenase-like predicted oxidoreductase
LLSGGDIHGREVIVRYRKLGSSDLEVSEISLGSWLTYSGGVAAEQTRACTEAAFDAGINFFDTANVYGQGAAESAWGEILAKHPRDSYLLATKVWGPMSDTDRGLSAAQIAKQIDASLTRLRTDHVDLYQAHRFDVSVPIEETVEALQRVVQQGKARYLGFSEWTPRQIRAAIEVAGPGLFVSSQPQYSMLWPAPEAEIFGLCAAHGISQIVWSPLAQGVLTGKYKPGQPVPEDSRFASESMSGSKDLVYSFAVLEAVQRLAPIADGLGLDTATLALAWVLRRGEVASAITGASRPEQVHANARAAGVHLGDATLRAIDEALGDTPVRVPTLAPFATEGVTHR